MPEVKGVWKADEHLPEAQKLLATDTDLNRGTALSNELNDSALDRLFRTARTRTAWTDRPVTEQQLRELYNLMKFGPTSGNSCPGRFVWVRNEPRINTINSADIAMASR